MYSTMKTTNTLAPIALINGPWCLTPLVMICSGSYIPGVVEFVVPFQQYLSKQSTHLDGTSVPVRTRLRANTAQPTQAGQLVYCAVTHGCDVASVANDLVPLRITIFEVKGREVGLLCILRVGEMDNQRA